VIDREGNLIEIEGCTEVTNGVFIGGGHVYLYDQDGMIVGWTEEELMTDVNVLNEAMQSVALAAKMGVKAVRSNRIDRGTTLGVLVKHTRTLNNVKIRL
jgi:hypothetical protein